MPMYRTAASCFCVLMISILVQTPWQGLLDIPKPSADEIAFAVSFGVLAKINVSSLQTAEDMEWVCEFATEAEGQPFGLLAGGRSHPSRRMSIGRKNARRTVFMDAPGMSYSLSRSAFGGW